jgi:hypothetical protein
MADWKITGSFHFVCSVNGARTFVRMPIVQTPFVRMPIVQMPIVRMPLVRMPFVRMSNCPNANCPNANCPNAICPNAHCPNAICPNANCPTKYHPTICFSIKRYLIIPISRLTLWLNLISYMTTDACKNPMPDHRCYGLLNVCRIRGQWFFPNFFWLFSDPRTINFFVIWNQITQLRKNIKYVLLPLDQWHWPYWN